MQASAVDEGLTPTMAEREQAQLILFSTAHRRATALMLDRRKVALDGLEIGDGDLLIEWSAPAGVGDDDRGGVAPGVAALDAATRAAGRRRV